MPGSGGRPDEGPGGGTPSGGAGLALEAVGLILEGQEPPFVGVVRGRMGEALWFDSPAELVDAGVDYFGPVGRRSRRGLRGSSKDDVAETTNVVWLDLDPPAGVDLGDARALVGEAERWLEALAVLEMRPSVYVFSGRGSWAYWKLDRHVGQGEAEALMRRLYAAFRPGGAEHDIGRVARMPGSVNEKTGLPAQVMAVDGARWDPERLGALLPEEDVPDAAEMDGGERRAAGVVRDLRPGGRLPALELPADLAGYVASRPSKRERAARGIDGSAMEQAIVSRLVNAGCSDGQIALFFDHHRLPRHSEEMRGRRRYGWLAVGIAKARAGMVPPSPSVSIGEGTYPDDDGEEEGYGAREPGWQFRRWVILRDMPEGLRKRELVAWVRERYALGRSQALRELDSLEGELGYLTSLPDKQDRRVKRMVRSEAGCARLASWSTVGTPFEFLKGLPAGEAADEPEPPEPVEEPEPVPPPPAAPPLPAARPRAPKAVSAVSRELAADRAEQLRRERSLINDTYRIHIPGHRWTFLQLLLPLDEWPGVLMHLQLRVGWDAERIPVYRSFVSPKDDALGGPDAEDPIEERTLRDDGYPARLRFIGVAAELAETPEGFALKTRTENGEELPNVGLLVQAYQNFYRPLRALRDRQDEVIAARKRGKGKKTAYELTPAGEGIDVPAGLAPDLDALLDHLADEAEMRAVLDSLPEGWRLVHRPRW